MLIMKQAVAKLNNLHIAPRKVRLVTNSLKNLSVQNAEAQLMYLSKRSAGPLLKLLRSAVANAKVKNLSLDKLYISSFIFTGINIFPL